MKLLHHPITACGILLLAAGSTVSATTLVAIWSPERLLLGADSAVITSDRKPPASACKVSQDGQSFYAFSGLVSDSSVGYDVMPLAHKAVQGFGDLSAHLKEFLQLTRDPLSRAVSAVRQDSPAQYLYLQQNHPVLQVIFAEVQHGPPSLGIAQFTLGPGGSLVGFDKIIAQGDDGRGTRIIYAGQQTQIRAYLHEHKDWAGVDPTVLLRDLIESEIKASNGEVGGPIDIVSIEANGANWVQKKSQCN